MTSGGEFEALNMPVAAQKRWLTIIIAKRRPHRLHTYSRVAERVVWACAPNPCGNPVAGRPLLELHPAASTNRRPGLSEPRGYLCEYPTCRQVQSGLLVTLEILSRSPG